MGQLRPGALRRQRAGPALSQVCKARCKAERLRTYPRQLLVRARLIRLGHLQLARRSMDRFERRQFVLHRDAKLLETPDIREYSRLERSDRVVERANGANQPRASVAEMPRKHPDSIVELLNTFSVKRYCLIGSMYDMVPHTTPLLVTGAASNLALQNELDLAKVAPSNYQGPTTILHLLGQKVLQLGIETFSLVVHMPNYLSFEEDYRGVVRLMEIIHSLYGITIPEADVNKAKEQEQQVSRLAEQIMQQEPRYLLALSQLETNYDARVGEQEETRLSPEVERFLQDLNNRFGQGQ